MISRRQAKQRRLKPCRHEFGPGLRPRMGHPLYEARLSISACFWAWSWPKTCQFDSRMPQCRQFVWLRHGCSLLHDLQLISGSGLFSIETLLWDVGNSLRTPMCGTPARKAKALSPLIEVMD